MFKLYRSLLSLILLFSFALSLASTVNADFFGNARASIFRGIEEGAKTYGVCINYNKELTSDSPYYREECQTIDCENPEDGASYDMVLCTSEAQAGVNATKNELNTTGITHTDTLGVLIVKYVNFLLPYLTLAAFLAFVYAGILYVTAYGNDENLEKAKKIMIYAAIGLIVVIASYSIVNFFTEGLVEELSDSASDTP